MNRCFFLGIFLAIFCLVATGFAQTSGLSRKTLAEVSLGVVQELEYLSSHDNQPVKQNPLMLNGTHGCSKKVHTERVASVKLNEKSLNSFILEQKSEFEPSLGMHTVILAADVSVVLRSQESLLFELLGEALQKLNQHAEQNPDIDDHWGYSSVREIELKSGGRIATQVMIAENGETQSRVMIQWGYLEPNQTLADLPFSIPK